MTHYELERFDSQQGKWVPVQPWRYETLSEAKRAVANCTTPPSIRILKCVKTPVED